MNYIAFSAFCFSVLMGFSAFCESIELGLLIPWGVINSNVVDSKLLNSKSKLQDFSVPTQIGDVLLPMAEVESQMHLNSIVQNNMITKIGTSDLRVEIHIPSFSINKQIVKQVGTANIIVNLSAKCQDIVLQQDLIQAEADVSFQSLNTEIHSQVKVTDLVWQPKSWRMLPFTCEGPEGFADLIEAEVSKQLLESEKFKMPLQVYLEQYFNNLLTRNIQKAMQPNLLDIQGKKYSYQLSRIDSMDQEGFTFVIRISNSDPEALDLSSSLNPADVVFKRNDFTSALSKSNPSLLISKIAYERILRMLLKEQQLKSSLNSVSSFSKLMQSRFLQFFVWKDLMKWPKSSQFTMFNSGKMTSDLQFNSKLANWDSNFLLDSYISGERDSRVWQYILFQNTLNMKFGLEVKQSALIVQPKYSKLKTNWKFGEDYLHHYHPKSYIAVSMITDAARKQFLSEAVSFKLPKIDIGSGIVLEAKQLHTDKIGNLDIEFSK